MHSDSHRAGDRIVVSSAVLEHLKELSAAALKVYVYLCSCNQGGPIVASIATICKATGQQNRAAITALKTLRERNLIVRNPGSGNQPNAYHLPFSATVSPPRPEQPATLEPMTIPLSFKDCPPTRVTRQAEDMSHEVTTISRSPKDPRQTTVRAQQMAPLTELIAICYRRIDAQELAQFKSWFPDEAILRRKLESVMHRGDGVAPEMEINFLRTMLEHLD
jgi:hypothetical protein